MIPAVSPNLEHTGISRSKHFPCKALFTLETNINTIRLQYQLRGGQGQRKPFINLVSGATVNTVLSRWEGGDISGLPIRLNSQEPT